VLPGTRQVSESDRNKFCPLIGGIFQDSLCIHEFSWLKKGVLGVLFAPEWLLARSVVKAESG